MGVDFSEMGEDLDDDIKTAKNFITLVKLKGFKDERHREMFLYLNNLVGGIGIFNKSRREKLIRDFVCNNPEIIKFVEDSLPDETSFR